MANYDYFYRFWHRISSHRHRAITTIYMHRYTEWAFLHRNWYFFLMAKMMYFVDVHHNNVTSLLFAMQLPDCKVWSRHEKQQTTAKRTSNVYQHIFFYYIGHLGWSLAACDDLGRQYGQCVRGRGGATRTCGRHQTNANRRSESYTQQNTRYRSVWCGLEQVWGQNHSRFLLLLVISTPLGVFFHIRRTEERLFFVFFFIVWMKKREKLDNKNMSADPTSFFSEDSWSVACVCARAHIRHWHNRAHRARFW